MARSWPDASLAEVALLQSERAYIDGTVGQDRGLALADTATWNSSHDPEASGKAVSP